MSIFFAKMGYGRYTMSVVTPTFIIEPKERARERIRIFQPVLFLHGYVDIATQLRHANENGYDHVNQ